MCFDELHDEGTTPLFPVEISVKFNNENFIRPCRDFIVNVNLPSFPLEFF
jgi:hypothetical protein